MTKISKCDLVQIDAEILHDWLRASQSCDVFEHGATAIAVARSLDGADLQNATELVDDQRAECFASDVLGDDQERLLALDHLLQERNQLGDAVDLVFVDENEHLVELDAHLLNVSHEVRAEVAAVEAHAFNNINHGLQALAFFNSDDAVLADLLEGLGHHLANFNIVVGADTGDGSDAAINLCNRLRSSGEFLDHGLDRAAHAADQRVGVCTSSELTKSRLEERLGENGGGGGAIAGVVGGLAGGFLDQLGAHVLYLVAELNLLGDADAVLGDVWSTPTAVEDGVAAAWAERALDGCCEFLDSGEQLLAGVSVKGKFLHGHGSGLRYMVNMVNMACSASPRAGSPVGAGCRDARGVPNSRMDWDSGRYRDCGAVRAS